MVFSTGYQANLGILSTLAGRGDHLVIDADSHASIYDGCRLGQRRGRALPSHRSGRPLQAPAPPERPAGRQDHRRRRPLLHAGRHRPAEGDRGRQARDRRLSDRRRGPLRWASLGENGRGLAEEAGVEDDVDFVVGDLPKRAGGFGRRVLRLRHASTSTCCALACRPLHIHRLPAPVRHRLDHRGPGADAGAARAAHQADGQRQARCTTGSTPWASPPARSRTPWSRSPCPTAAWRVGFWNALLEPACTSTWRCRRPRPRARRCCARPSRPPTPKPRSTPPSSCSPKSAASSASSQPARRSEIGKPPPRGGRGGRRIGPQALKAPPAPLFSGAAPRGRLRLTATHPSSTQGPGPLRPARRGSGGCARRA